MKHASMNRIYRLVWNAALGVWVAVAENAKGRGKGGSSRRAVLALAAVMAAIHPHSYAADAANASVTAGAGSVSTTGATTTINQASQRMAIDWTRLSTTANEALVFKQPGASSIALNGSYSKLGWSVSRLQRITDQAQVWLVLTGQQARKNLDSSEKFSLGGPTSIRAYPTGEASGDEGYRGTLELRHALAQSVQGSVFYDFGSVRVNKTPFAATANNRHLAGAGFGASAVWNKVQGKASLAWRTSGGAPVSIPASAAKSPTLWLQASVEF
jgi:hemolysin activation/secretion protein